MTETQYASADDFISSPEPEGHDFTLPSGRVVRVRGLTRFELMSFSRDNPDNAVYEQRVVSACMIQPPMSRGKVEAWQKSDTAGGDLSALSEHLRESSGLGQGAGKSAVDPVRN
jgi:hypothetical protein